MQAYSDGSHFVSLLNCKKFGWWVEEEDDPPPPTQPTPKWSSRVGKMSNEEEEEDDPHPLPTHPNGHPELVRWAMRRRRKMTPTPYPPTPKWSSRVGEMINEVEEEDDPHPLPTPPQMVLTVKNSRWVIICVFHACPPCTHYTAVPAYWDPEGLASSY